MSEAVEILKTCILFKGLSRENISAVLNEINYKELNFAKEQTIAIEGDNCTSIGIVIKGVVEIQKIYESGKTITVDRLNPGDIFGEVIIFSSMNKYPSTVLSAEKSKVIFISREEILKTCSKNTIILNNFMGLLSNKILMLNKRLKMLSYHTIRQKVANFILEEYNKQKNPNLTLNCSRKEMADQLGIPRPSLSRELIKMRDDGLIEFHGKNLIVKDLIALEDIMFD